MDGVIIINKPQGCTSHDVVYKIKKIVNEKVGHTGTLDPMAQGVLPLLIGKGTLCSKYLINHDKIYQVELTLGIKTDTADGEGKIIEEKDLIMENMAKEYIQKILQLFKGKQKQIPPMYSAIKVKGKKLYEYARKGQEIKLEPREIEIYSIALDGLEENKIQFTVSCSKGTYIRSLCEDIAERLGTVGYMSRLNRIKVGKFDIKEAINIEELQKLESIEQKREYIDKKIISIEKLFMDYPRVNLPQEKLTQFLNGVKLKFSFTSIESSKEENMLENEKAVYRIYTEGKFIGIATVQNKLLKRDIIL